MLQLVVCFCLFDKSSKSTDFNAKILCSQTRLFSHIENKKKNRKNISTEKEQQQKKISSVQKELFYSSPADIQTTTDKTVLQSMPVDAASSSMKR